MQSSYASLPDLVIGAGASTSNIFNGVYVYHDATEFILYGSGSYGVETYTLEVNQDQQATASTAGWVTASHAGADLTPPAAGKSKSFGIELTGAGSIRIKASANTAGVRTWKANKLWAWG